MSDNVRALRPRDEIWDCLVELFGDPGTRTARGFFNAKHKELAEVGASRDEIRYRVLVGWPMHFPGATCTPGALVKWWGLLGTRPQRMSERQVAMLKRRFELGQGELDL